MRYFLSAVAAALFAQAPARPRFEVASIRPSDERGTMYVRALPGGRLLVNAPVRLMIMNAYGLQFSQLAGAPDWVNSEIWAIDARAGGSARREELMLMLQSLLEERFQLKAHRTSREMPVFALTVAKNGPKLPTAKPAGCATPVPGKAEATAPPCGRVRISMSAEGVLMEGGMAGMGELARVLAIPLRRPVLDHTGLNGVYDVRLQFTNDGGGETPGVFTAIQEQLGLRLESTKMPVEVLVVDRIERPSAN